MYVQQYKIYVVCRNITIYITIASSRGRHVWCVALSLRRTYALHIHECDRVLMMPA